MKKWKAVIAGLVLTLSLSAATACGTTRNDTKGDENRVTTENAGNGNLNNGTGVNNGAGTGTDVNNGANNGTNVDANGNRLDANGNPISDVVEGVGEAGKDIINGVENGVNDLTNDNANTTNTTNGNR